MFDTLLSQIPGLIGILAVLTVCFLLNEAAYAQHKRAEEQRLKRRQDYE